MSRSYLERVELELLRVPLKTPYKLVFGNVEAFDTLLVTVTFADGRSGVGEATILTGYTEETLEQCWQAARTIGSELPGTSAEQARGRLSVWLGGESLHGDGFCDGDGDGGRARHAPPDGGIGAAARHFERNRTGPA